MAALLRRVAERDPVSLEAPAIVTNLQPQIRGREVELDAHVAGARVLDDVGEALLEDQKYLAPRVRTEGDLRSGRRRVEFERDALDRQQVAGEPTHALDQILQMVLLRIDGPDDVAHRF